MALLEVNQVHAYYGNIHALKGISLRVEEGEIVALIGGNGAGKTTTLRTISCLLRPRTGTVYFRGEDLAGYPAHHLVSHGIAMVPEGRHVFPFMSVRDNLLMGAFLRRDKVAVKDDLERMLTRFPRLRERWKQQAGTMSGGEQQMVAIARALMAKPRLLLMDEPSLGLAPLVVQEIARNIVAINREDHVSVILVEQNSRMALKISHRAYALETGRVALSGRSADLVNDETIKKLYLGAT